MSRPIAADSALGRLMIALRAGPMIPAEICERLGHSASAQISEGRARGLIEKAADGESARLTAAGVAACPLRNPLSAIVTPPKSAAMIARRRLSPSPLTPQEPKMKSTVPPVSQRVLAAIQAAGAAGITRQKLLTDITGANEAAIDMSISKAVRDGKIHRPKPGFLVHGAAPEPQEARAAIQKPPAKEAAPARNIPLQAIEYPPAPAEHKAPAGKLFLLGTDRQLRVIGVPGTPEILLSAAETAELSALLQSALFERRA